MAINMTGYNTKFDSIKNKMQALGSDIQNLPRTLTAIDDGLDSIEAGGGDYMVNAGSPNLINNYLPSPILTTESDASVGGINRQSFNFNATKLLKGPNNKNVLYNKVLKKFVEITGITTLQCTVYLQDQWEVRTYNATMQIPISTGTVTVTLDPSAINYVCRTTTGTIQTLICTDNTYMVVLINKDNITLSTTTGTYIANGTSSHLQENLFPTNVADWYKRSYIILKDEVPALKTQLISQYKTNPIYLLGGYTITRYPGTSSVQTTIVMNQSSALQTLYSANP